MAEESPSLSRPRRGRPPVRGPLQRQQLMDAVARKINLDGPGSIVLVDIGAEVGLSRSSVYYYCRDAADLAHQAYVEAITLLAQDLAAARAASQAPGAQLSGFIRRVLADDHPPMAVLNDIAFLPEALCSGVRIASEHNVEALTNMIQEGQAKGEFRKIDAGLSARTLLNILSWALVSLPWLARRGDAQDRAVYIETICDVFLGGLARPGVKTAPCTLAFDNLMHRSIDAFDRVQTAELKAEQIMAAASRLFNTRGVDGVTLEEISAELGATKGVLYHQFKDKSELIERCYVRAFDIYELIMQTSLAAETDPLSRAMMTAHLNAQAQLSANAPLAPQPGYGKFSRARRIDFTQRARALAEASATNLDMAAEEGLSHKLVSITASEISAGYFLGLQRWSRAEMTHREIADFVVDLLLRGLRHDR
jgi:AcrR family transcriptional regulator